MCQILPLATWQSATSASAAHGGLLRFVFFLFVISPQDKSDFKMESGQAWRVGGWRLELHPGLNTPSHIGWECVK